MKPRPKKFLAAFVGAVATVTMMGVGSAAAKTPPPKPPIVSESAANDGTGNGTPFSNGATPRSFKPR